MCKKLMHAAAKYLETGTNLMHGIEACSEVLESVGLDLDDDIKHDCLCTRAGLYLKVCLLLFSSFQSCLAHDSTDHKILICRGSGKTMFTWPFEIATEHGILIPLPFKHIYTWQRRYYR